MSDFKWRHFERDVILWVVRRWLAVDHSTIYRGVQKYAPEIENWLLWHWRRPQSTSWRVYEAYVKVHGKWTNLYRVVDKYGKMIDFYLSPTRDAKAVPRQSAEWLEELGEANGHQY